MQKKTKLLLAALAVSGALLTGCSSVDLNPNAQEDLAMMGDPAIDPAHPLNQQSIYFAFDSYSVPADAQAEVQMHARYLSLHPQARVTLEGNTDNRGGREYNLALGQKRSESVKARLQLLGVSADRMESVSFGKEKPRALGNDEAAYQENRRVDIKYLPQ